MTKREGNWDDKKPDIGERIATRMSIHASMGQGLGGIPELTDGDFSAAIGLLKNRLYKTLLGARFGGWVIDQDQLREMALRHSWSRWQEKRRTGDMNGPLNERITDLALLEWCTTPERREKTADTYRAKLLQVGYRRFRAELKTHYEELRGWLDAETANALHEASRKVS